MLICCDSEGEKRQKCKVSKTKQTLESKEKQTNKQTNIKTPVLQQSRIMLRVEKGRERERERGKRNLHC